MSNLKGIKVLVTGGSPGIGKAWEFFDYLK
jgi:NAD(P)-dependent dehydrogenase (short-subunit alcohol dehydrogenase family)